MSGRNRRYKGPHGPPRPNRIKKLSGAQQRRRRKTRETMLQAMQDEINKLDFNSLFGVSEHDINYSGRSRSPYDNEEEFEGDNYFAGPRYSGSPINHEFDGYNDFGGTEYKNEDFYEHPRSPSHQQLDRERNRNNQEFSVLSRSSYDHRNNLERDYHPNRVSECRSRRERDLSERSRSPYDQRRNIDRDNRSHRTPDRRNMTNRNFSGLSSSPNDRRTTFEIPERRNERHFPEHSRSPYEQRHHFNDDDPKSYDQRSNFEGNIDLPERPRSPYDERHNFDYDNRYCEASEHRNIDRRNLSKRSISPYQQRGLEIRHMDFREQVEPQFDNRQCILPSRNHSDYQNGPFEPSYPTSDRSISPRLHDRRLSSPRHHSNSCEEYYSDRNDLAYDPHYIRRSGSISPNRVNFIEGRYPRERSHSPYQNFVPEQNVCDFEHHPNFDNRAPQELYESFCSHGYKSRSPSPYLEPNRPSRVQRGPPKCENSLGPHQHPRRSPKFPEICRSPKQGSNRPDGELSKAFKKEYGTPSHSARGSNQKEPDENRIAKPHKSFENDSLICTPNLNKEIRFPIYEISKGPLEPTENKYLEPHKDYEDRNGLNFKKSKLGPSMAFRSTNDLNQKEKLINDKNQFFKSYKNSEANNPSICRTPDMGQSEIFKKELLTPLNDNSKTLNSNEQFLFLQNKNLEPQPILEAENLFIREKLKERFPSTYTSPIKSDENNQKLLEARQKLLASIEGEKIPFAKFDTRLNFQTIVSTSNVQKGAQDFNFNNLGTQKSTLFGGTTKQNFENGSKNTNKSCSLIEEQNNFPYAKDKARLVYENFIRKINAPTVTNETKKQNKALYSTYSCGRRIDKSLENPEQLNWFHYKPLEPKKTNFDLKQNDLNETKFSEPHNIPLEPLLKPLEPPYASIGSQRYPQSNNLEENRMGIPETTSNWSIKSYFTMNQNQTVGETLPLRGIESSTSNLEHNTPTFVFGQEKSLTKEDGKRRLSGGAKRKLKRKEEIQEMKMKLAKEFFERTGIEENYFEKKVRNPYDVGEREKPILESEKFIVVPIIWDLFPHKRINILQTEIIKEYLNSKLFDFVNRGEEKPEFHSVTLSYGVLYIICCDERGKNWIEEVFKNIPHICDTFLRVADISEIDMIKAKAHVKFITTRRPAKEFLLVLEKTNPGVSIKKWRILNEERLKENETRFIFQMSVACWIELAERKKKLSFEFSKIDFQILYKNKKHKRRIETILRNYFKGTNHVQAVPSTSNVRGIPSRTRSKKQNNLNFINFIPEKSNQNQGIDIYDLDEGSNDEIYQIYDEDSDDRAPRLSDIQNLGTKNLNMDEIYEISD